MAKFNFILRYVKLNIIIFVGYLKFLNYTLVEESKNIKPNFMQLYMKVII